MTDDGRCGVPVSVPAGVVLVSFQCVACVTEILDDGALSQSVAGWGVAHVAPILRLVGGTAD